MRAKDLKSLLVVTGVVEAGTGLALLFDPLALMSLLLGAKSGSPEALFVARIAGAALLAIGVACGLASGDTGSRAQLGVLTGILVYNVAIILLLGYAGMFFRPVGVALWPAVVVHTALAAWCIECFVRGWSDKRSPSNTGRKEASGL
jgi:hypothetical protein